MIPIVRTSTMAYVQSKLATILAAIHPFAVVAGICWRLRETLRFFDQQRRTETPDQRPGPRSRARGAPSFPCETRLSWCPPRSRMAIRPRAPPPTLSSGWSLLASGSISLGSRPECWREATWEEGESRNRDVRSRRVSCVASDLGIRTWGGIRRRPSRTSTPGSAPRPVHPRSRREFVPLPPPQSVERNAAGDQPHVAERLRVVAEERSACRIDLLG
jgi:hypothetical protein